MRKFNKLSSFWLKVIAMVTMTFDHIGVVFASFWGTKSNIVFYETCRYIGRFALPLYCFLLVEAEIKNKNYKKYNIKLGIMAIIISIGLAVCQFVTSLGMKEVASAGNIFLDLLLASTVIYCLKHDKKWVKALALLPIIISILSFVAKGVEQAESCAGCAYRVTVWWYPAFLRLQYDWLTLAFCLGYFASYYVAKLIYQIREENTGVSAEAMVGTNEWRIMVNLSALFFTMFFSVIYYLFHYISPDIVFWNPRIQLFGAVAGVLLLFYSGSRGYNAKWFNNFAYLYYLVHIGVIFIVCYLIYIV